MNTFAQKRVQIYAHILVCASTTGFFFKKNKKADENSIIHRHHM
jgi:hypothetical protein